MILRQANCGCFDNRILCEEMFGELINTFPRRQSAFFLLDKSIASSAESAPCDEWNSQGGNYGFFSRLPCHSYIGF
jgi:hypothetical protein